MKRKNIQQFHMLERVADFGAKHVGLFPQTTIAGEILAEIRTVVQKLSDHSTLQVSGNTSVRRSSMQRKEARHALKTQLEAIEQTARALEIKDFWLPRKATETILIHTGHAFAEAAEPLKAEFIRHGLPPAFVENLKTAVQTLEGSILGRAAGKATRSGAIREFDKMLDEALRLLHRFEALVENSMSDNSLVMAAWDVARRVERIPQSKTEAKPQPQLLASQTPPAAGEEAATATA